jgi:adenylate kinase family enzyme
MVLVLVGLPGSGKSTFAETLEKKGRWSRVNQDLLHSKVLLVLFFVALYCGS